MTYIKKLFLALSLAACLAPALPPFPVAASEPGTSAAADGAAGGDGSADPAGTAGDDSPDLADPAVGDSNTGPTIPAAGDSDTDPTIPTTWDGSIPEPGTAAPLTALQPFLDQYQSDSSRRAVDSGLFRFALTVFLALWAGRTITQRRSR